MPGKHGVETDRFVMPQNEPAGHAVHNASPTIGAKDPRGQVCVAVRPVALQKEPSGHGMQAEAPEDGANVPGTQKLHADWLVAANVPGEQINPAASPDALQN